jgi:hypothetical protein
MRLCGLWCILLVLITGARSLAATVAIVAEAELDKVSAQLEGELGRHAFLKRVDRSEITRVLAEQKLAAGQAEAVKIGQVVGADGVLLLSRPQPNVMEARLVAVGPGVVLWSSAHPADKYETWLKSVADRAAESDAKLTVKQGDAIALAVLNLRAAVKNPASINLERDLALLLAHRLADEPAVYVLERQKLEALVREKIFDSTTQPFATGRYLLDGTFDTTGDAFTATLRLRAADGDKSETIAVKGDVNDLATAVDAMAVEVVKRTHGAVAASSWDPKREARQFRDEAVWGEVCGQDWRTVQSAADAAWALGHRDRRIAVLRVQSRMRGVWGGRFNFAGNATFGKQPDRASAEPANIRDRLAVMAEGLQLFLDEVDGTLKTPSEINTISTWSLASDAQFVATFLLRDVRSRPDWRDFAGLTAEVRALLQQIDALAIKAIRTEEPRRTYFGRKSAFLQYWYDTPEQQVAAYRQTMTTTYTYLVGRGEMLRNIARSSTHNDDMPNLVAWDERDEPRVAGVWDAFVKELSDSHDPEYRALGYRLQMKNGDADAWRLKIVDLAWEHREGLRQGKIAYYILDENFLDLKPNQPREQPYRDRFFRLLLDACTGDEKGHRYVEFLVIERLGLCPELSPEQAKQLYDGLTKYSNSLTQKHLKGHIDRAAESLVTFFPALQSTTRPSNVELAATPKWPGVGGKSFHKTLYRPLDSKLHGGKLWMLASDETGIYIVGGVPGDADFETIKAPDVVRQQVVATPTFRTGPQMYSHGVTDDEILLSLQWYTVPADQKVQTLHVYNRKTQTWRSYDQAPLQLRGTVVRVGDELFCRFGTYVASIRDEKPNEGIVRLDAATGIARLLASNRQIPAQTPLDTLDLELEDLVAGRDGELLVHAACFGFGDLRMRRVFAYKPATNTWREMPPTEWASQAESIRVPRHTNYYPRLEGKQFRWGPGGQWQYWGWTRDNLHSGEDLSILYGDESRPNLVSIPVWIEPDLAGARERYFNAEGKEHVIARRDAREVQSFVPTPAGMVLVHNARHQWWFAPIAPLRERVKFDHTEPKVIAGNARDVIVEAVSNGVRHLWRIDAAGTPTQLTRGWHDSLTPAVSPGGKQIAFVSYRDDNYDLFLTSADGGTPRNLTDAWGDDADPAWSPDGNQIAFVSRFGGKVDLCVIAADGTGRRTIVAGQFTTPAWSPDGLRLLAGGNHDGKQGVFEITLAGGAVRHIAKAPADCHPAYTHDGRIVFIQAGADKLRRLAIVKADGAGEKLLLDTPGVDWPTVSPDRRRVLYRTGGADQGNSPGPFDWHALDLTTNATQRLTATADHVWRMRWGGQ